MNSESSTPETDLDLTQFACRVLKEHGAILESGHEVINILLPKSLSENLDVEEYISMAKNPEEVKTFEGESLYPIQFQTPLLDKIISMAGSKPPFLQAALKFNGCGSFGTLLTTILGGHNFPHLSSGLLDSFEVTSPV